MATVHFTEAAFADRCVEFMNNRWFAKRRISAETWDGQTKYAVDETEEERDARLKKWEEYLETGNETQKADSSAGSELTSAGSSCRPAIAGLSSTARPAGGLSCGEPSSRPSSSDVTEKQPQPSSSKLSHQNPCSDPSAVSSTTDDAVAEDTGTASVPRNNSSSQVTQSLP